MKITKSRKEPIYSGRSARGLILTTTPRSLCLYLRLQETKSLFGAKETYEAPKGTWDKECPICLLYPPTCLNCILNQSKKATIEDVPPISVSDWVAWMGGEEIEEEIEEEEIDEETTDDAPEGWKGWREEARISMKDCKPWTDGDKE